MNSKMDRSIITCKRYTLTNSQGNTYLFAHSATAMYRLAVQVFHKKTALLIICLFVFSLFSSVSLQSTSETLDEARYGAVNPPGTWDSSNIEFTGPNECRKFSDYFEGTAPNGFTRLTDEGEVARREYQKSQANGEHRRRLRISLAVRSRRQVLDEQWAQIPVTGKQEHEQCDEESLQRRQDLYGC